ncbi:MnhB domain-containing protein [Haloarchaeobius sp. HRN-SO-5]|uniref:MnhB domain-containing protein n=1 Tax=Haloarchaeobius sp. HRN-SO-5 TaxID=3446118 RepID=UPI003EBBB637
MTGAGPPGEDRPDAHPSGRPLDSPVVTKTVRLTTPFVVTFGLFTMFHGTSSVGGGFQGGVVVAAGIITVAFSFGLTQTRRWLSAPTLTWLAVSGVLVFATVATVAILFGGEFLDLSAYPVPKAVVYGVELVELGIGATVATTILVMVLQLGVEADR